MHPPDGELKSGITLPRKGNLGVKERKNHLNEVSPASPRPTNKESKSLLGELRYNAPTDTLYRFFPYIIHDLFSI